MEARSEWLDRSALSSVGEALMAIGSVLAFPVVDLMVRSV
jgi:hypothetical protein